MDELNNIWSNEDELSEEELVNYIKQNSPDDDSHFVEEKMIDDPFLNDAVEGLQQVTDKEKISAHINDLHKNLQQQIVKSKQKKEKRKIKDLNWIVFAVILILALCVLAFTVYFMIG